MSSDFPFDRLRWVEWWGNLCDLQPMRGLSKRFEHGPAIEADSRSQAAVEIDPKPLTF